MKNLQAVEYKGCRADMKKVMLSHLETQRHFHLKWSIFGDWSWLHHDTFLELSTFKDSRKSKGGGHFVRLVISGYFTFKKATKSFALLVIEIFAIT